MGAQRVFGLLLSIACIYSANAQFSSCPLIAINDLGTTTEFTSGGLISRALVPPGEANVIIPVRIRDFATVCDASGDRINTSSFVSVVVEFHCDFQSSTASLSDCSDPSTVVTRQYQFQCTEENGQPVWGTLVSGSNLFVQTLNPTATLSTPLADQCRRCIDDQQSSRADPTTHCDPCPSQCNRGQGRCYPGQVEDVCCNFYQQGNCIDNCSSGLVADSNFICVCPPLILVNGIVSYSMEMGVEQNIGNVATHTCVSGYQLLPQGMGNTRICTISGWSGQDFMCAKNCTAGTILSESGISYTWPMTSGGETATLICPLNSEVIVTRNCSDEGLWQTIIDDGCTVNEQLEIINSSFTNLTSQTYGEAVAMLSEFTEATANNTEVQTSEVLNEVATYFKKLEDFVNESQVIINMTVIVDVVRVVNSLLQWEPGNVVVASSSSVVESFESIVSTYAQQLSLNETQTFITPSLTVVAVLESVDILAQRGRSFLINDSDLMLGSEDQVEPGQLSPQLDAAISLPATLFEQIDDRDNIGIFFALHEASTLFPIDENPSSTFLSPRKASVGSHILAATVGPGINFQNLDEPVTILLRLQITNGNFIAQDTERCVTWDFTLRDWVTSGCTTAAGEDGVITCTCNHLTNFAVLVDICLRQEDCEPSRVDQALTYISYIGISVSTVCLIFTILTLLIFKKIREKDISKYHIQLCFALLCMFLLTLILVSLSAEKVTTIHGGCVSLSLLVHYFSLVAVMWMGAEALLMFQKVVIVFVQITAKFITIVSVICWTVPIAFILVPFIVDMANGRDDTSDIVVHRAKMKEGISYCFLSHIGALMGSFLAPILVIIFINTIIFIWVVVVVSRHTRDKAARTNTAISKQQILRMMISISGVLFLFGLTWLFFVLIISVPGLRETFQILFTVFNSLQGFFVFAFILFTEGFSYWKEIFLLCYKSKPTQIPLQVNENKTADASTLSEIPHKSLITDHVHCEVDTKKPIQKMKKLESLRDQPLMEIASPTELE